MRFTVPQFIEHEAKIFGPITFKQFSFMGGAGIVVFIIYFLLPSSLFLILAIILIGVTALLSFVKMNGRSLPLILIDMLRFALESKIYIWKKKEQPMIIYKKREKVNLIKKTTEKKETTLKIGGESRLKKINTDLETKTK